MAWRTLKNVFTNPSLLFPSLAFPLFFFTAFAGGLSQVANVPGFDYPPGYTAFQFCFVLLQSAAFGGVFTGFGIARDFEYGSRAGSPRRAEPDGIVLGYAHRGAGSLVRDGDRASRSWRWSAGMRSAAAGSTCSGSTRSRLIVNIPALLWACGSRDAGPHACRRGR